MNELRIERTNAWLEPHHIQKISDAYWKFKDVDGFAKVTSKEDVLKNNGILSLQLYVKPLQEEQEHEIEGLVSQIRENQENITLAIETLFSKLKNIGIDK